MRFPADPAWIGRSRRWVVGLTQQAGASGHAMRIVALLVTEAVANAVVHGPGHGDVVVHVTIADGVVRVGVRDDSEVLPVVKDVGPAATGGRGMMLIDRLSRRWGVERHRGAGKTVWFEVTL